MSAMPTTILVVEDEKIIAKGIEKRLKGLGYAVVGLASTGEEAIPKATELRPDLVLMDIHLGAGMDGIAAADIIRSRLGVPVVYLTAHSDEGTLQRAKLTGPFGYVIKPYEDKDLQTAIEIGLHRHELERRLRENEQWLADILGSIGDGVIATDVGGRVRFMNMLAEQMTGWEQREAVGLELETVFRIIEETSGDPVPNPALEVLRNGEIAKRSVRTLLSQRAGTEMAIEDSAAPIRNGSGGLAGAVLVFRDITERRRLERRLEEQRLELVAANARLEVLATTDSLTSLNNRRSFDMRLSQEVERLARIPLPLSLILLDVDQFKLFNDTFGHRAGDVVLASVARLLQENARTTDFVARYGGEEFAIILPNTGQSGALFIAERVRRAVAQRPWRDRAITVSAGLATLNANNGGGMALVYDADAALYQSKRSGRNCVHHAAQLASRDICPKETVS